MKILIKPFFLLILLLTLVIFWMEWRNFGIINKIEILGNDYLSKQEILSVIPSGNIRISEIDFSKIAQQLKKNLFVKEVSFETRWMHTLVVHLQVQELVGEVVENSKTGYLSSQGKVIPESSVVTVDFPKIFLSSKISDVQLQLLAKQLAIFQYSYKNFFQTIRRINLLSNKNVSIIIESPLLGGLRKYEMFRFPRVRDLIEIAYLDGKYSHGSTVILGDNSVIVKD